MKLLLDENLSHRLVELLSHEYLILVTSERSVSAPQKIAKSGTMQVHMAS